MPRIGPPPRGAMGAENVSDLQLVPGLQPRVLLEPPSQRAILQWLEPLERADRIADRFGGNVSVAGRRAQV